jgi:hypothetical protein
MADTPFLPSVDGLTFPLRESFFKPKVRTDFENGIVQSRARFTRGKRRFVLKYDKIDPADCETLRAFFDERGGQSFRFLHPLTGKQFTCIFSDDSFDPSLVEGNWYDVTVNIEEV